MKTLVIDDDATKVKDILVLLMQAGISESTITVATTGLAARENLAATQFDFVVLDLFLPLRDGDTPDPRGGFNLLTEITMSDRFKKPGHVLAVTGFEELKKEFETKFNNGIWAIDFYDPSDSGWRDRLKAKAAYVSASLACPPTYETDLCVITALSTPELDAVRSLPWAWSDAEAFDDVGYQYSGSFGAGRRVIAVAAPRMGMVAAATLATKVILRARPRVLAITGICAGFRGECKLGDVLVADPCWDWQMGKYKKEAFEIGPDQIGTPLEISQKMKILGADQSALAQIWSQSQAEKPDNVPAILGGPVASGSAVLADKAVSAIIIGQHRKALGVDMELYGVFSAVRDAPRPKPLVVGLKSVCDFADQYKNDKYQKYCAEVSARCLSLLVSRFEDALFT